MDIYDLLSPPFQKYHLFDLKDLPQKHKRNQITQPLVGNVSKTVLEHTQCKGSSTLEDDACCCRPRPRFAIHHTGSLCDQAPVKILGTCRQAYDECLPHLYTKGVFAFDSVLQPYPSESITFLKSISPRAFISLRHLRLVLGTPAGPRRRLSGTVLPNSTSTTRAIQVHIKRFRTHRNDMPTEPIHFRGGLQYEQLDRGELSYMNIWSLDMVWRNHKESVVKHLMIRFFWYQSIMSITAALLEVLRTANFMDAWTTILPAFVYTDDESLPTCKVPSG